jgi:hypothetical protein
MLLNFSAWLRYWAKAKTKLFNPAYALQLKVFDQSLIILSYFYYLAEIIAI